MKLIYDMSEDTAMQTLDYDFEIDRETEYKAIAIIVAEFRDKKEKFNNILERDAFEKGIEFMLNHIETQELEDAVDIEFHDYLWEFFEDQAKETWKDMQY